MNDNEALWLNDQLCFSLYAASREVIKQYRPFLDKIGLTYTQYITMMVIWKEKKISVKHLGRTLYLDSGTLTPVLKSLEAKGFIRRHRSEEDERVLLVEVTPEGEAIRDGAMDIPAKIASCIKIPAEDIKELRERLNDLLSSFGGGEGRTEQQQKLTQIVLDLSNCKFYFEIHERIAAAFDFPAWYAKNWDAFAQLIRNETRAISVTISGINTLPKSWLGDIKKMLDILSEKARSSGGKFDYQVTD